MFEDIYANIRKVLERAQDVKYHEHIGGDHYISGTIGFLGVDFRRRFLPHDEKDPKPTKKGRCILSTSVVHRRMSSTASLQYVTSSHAPACVLAAVTATNSRGHVLSLENEVTVSPAQQPGTVYHHRYMNSQTQSLSKNISKPICSLVPLVHSFYIHIVSCWPFL